MWWRRANLNGFFLTLANENNLSQGHSSLFDVTETSSQKSWFSRRASGRGQVQVASENWSFAFCSGDGMAHKAKLRSPLVPQVAHDLLKPGVT